jgi:hypothetical protein
METAGETELDDTTTCLLATKRGRILGRVRSHGGGDRAYSARAAGLPSNVLSLADSLRGVL